MPTFSVEDVDIYPYEFVNSCSKKEIIELITELCDNGYLPNDMRYFNKIDEKKQGFHPLDSFYEEALNKLHRNSHRLSKEDEETIIKIADKL